LKHRDGVIARSRKNTTVAEDGKKRTEDSIHHGDSHFLHLSTGKKLHHSNPVEWTVQEDVLQYIVIGMPPSSMERETHTQFEFSYPLVETRWISNVGGRVSPLNGEFQIVNNTETFGLVSRSFLANEMTEE
jgi:hypothetical protein